MRLSLTALTSVLVIVTGFGQGRVYVTPGGTGDGSSWAEATGDLAGEMASAVTGTELWVAKGTYLPTACMGDCDESDRAASFRLRRGVRVIGGFTGVETEATGADRANATILSGDIGRVDDPSDNAFNVLVCEDCGAKAAVTNVTITGGYADRAGRTADARGRAGAGVYLDGSDGGEASPTFTACAIVDNDAFGQGGGVYIDGSRRGEASPSFVDCVIAFNTARADGGGVYALALEGETSPTFADTQIRSNGTVNPGDGSGQSGGGLYVSAPRGVAAVTLDRCLFTRNAADVSVPGRRDGNSSANGGAVYMTSAEPNPALTLTARNTVLSHNSSYSGGAVYNNRGHVTFANVSVVANHALGSGGAGGGLYLNGGGATVVNSLSYGNAVPNNDDAGRDFRFVNGALDVSYTLLEAASAAEAFSCARLPCDNDAYDAGPGVLYGADAMFVDVNADVPELQATSPAINAGDNAHAELGGDYFGARRIAHERVDLGAVERDIAPMPVELVRLGAKPTADGAMSLTWASASENGLGSYLVLRSESGDAGGFVELREVLAMGGGEYAYVDRAVAADVQYSYRLRSVGVNGETHDSDVVSAAIEAGGHPSAANSTEVATDLNTGEIYVRIAPRENARTVYATLSDAAGRKLRLWPLTTDGEHVLSIWEYPDGEYVLRLTEGGRDVSTTLLARSRRMSTAPAEAPTLAVEQQ